MEKSILESLKGKRVRISCIFGNSSQQITYVGIIKELTDSAMVFDDRFDGNIVLDLSVVKEAKEVHKNV